MKRIITLVGDLNSLGFNYDTYKKLQENRLTKKYVNTIWRNLVSELPLSSDLLIKLRNGEDFRVTITKNDVKYKLKLEEDLGDNHPTAVPTSTFLGALESDVQQNIGFNIRLHHMEIKELTIGQMSKVKQGCYYSYKNNSLNFSYFNEAGEETYATMFTFNYHKYDFKLDRSKLIYSFVGDKLLSFQNTSVEVTVKFYKFVSSANYKVSEIIRGNVAVKFFYKGNIKVISKKIDDKQCLTVYYSNGSLKCKYSYQADTGILDGMYIQYDSQGLVKIKTTWKAGDRHGVCERYTDGNLVEKSHYKHGKKDGSYYKIEDGKETIRTYSQGRVTKRR
jgi:antitoxin component YwqK of YwqJK toxin-antitoxin module